MEDSVRAGECGVQRFGPEHVDGGVFHVQALQSLGFSPVGGADLIAAIEECADEVCAHMTVGASDDDKHGRDNMMRSRPVWPLRTKKR